MNDAGFILILDVDLDIMYIWLVKKNLKFWHLNESFPRDPPSKLCGPQYILPVKVSSHLVTDTLQCSVLLKMCPVEKWCSFHWKLFSGIWHRCVVYMVQFLTNCTTTVVQYGKSKHCADQEAAKLTRVRAVKGSKRENLGGGYLIPSTCLLHLTNIIKDS